jgi:hypothetical protein
MEIYSIRQGEALEITVTLLDDQGDPIPGFSGSEVLTSPLWPGGNLPAAAYAQVAWLDFTVPSISLSIAGSVTATLAEGRYFGLIDLLDVTDAHLEAYRYAIDILLAPGSAVAPPTYCLFPDLLKYGRRWLRTLQTEDVEAGFLEECGRARSWLDDLIVSAWQGFRTRGLDPGGYGPPLGGIYASNYPSIWLRQQLDAGGLAVRDIVIECTAKKALAFICEGQVGSDNKTFNFAKLAAYYHREANAIQRCIRAEMNTDPTTGYPQFVVTLGTMDVRG